MERRSLWSKSNETPPIFLSILLAEDNVVNQKVAMHLLNSIGYRADLAANGLEVLDALKRQTYDIILMDMQMPELDGLEASRQVVALYPSPQDRPKIIALTANAMQGDRELCIEAGMDDYFSKPIRKDELLEALERNKPSPKIGYLKKTPSIALTPMLRSLSLVLFATFALTTSLAAKSMPAPPNILFIMSDDHAVNAISAYGGRLAEVAPTPNIDRLGREGTRLDKTFVTNSICTPSRAVILSGQHSHLNTVRTLGDAFPGPDAGVPNVAEILRRSGYHTALFGKWHLRSKPWGFDTWKVGPGQGFYHDPVFIDSTQTDIDYNPNLGNKLERTPGYYTDLVTDYALDWLDNRPDKKPFFMMLHHKAPHGKWEPADRHKDYLADVEIPEPASLWEDFSHRSEATRRMGTSITGRLAGRRTMVGDVQKPDWPAGTVDMTGMTEKEKGQAAYQKYLHDYLACVKAVDENVGRVLDYLDESGLAENTLVIYTSDQGMLLGEHDYFDKRWIYEECLQMPFFARFPGRIKAGSVNDTHLTSNLDFAQTLLDFAHVDDAPEIAEMQGYSLRGILTGNNPSEWRDAVYYRYWMHLSHHHIPGHYGVRTDRYKLAFVYGLGLDASLGNGDYPATTAGWELYDLQNDPNEMNNVYNDPTYAAVIPLLKARLSDLKQEYRDNDSRYPELMKVREVHWND